MPNQQRRATGTTGFSPRRSLGVAGRLIGALLVPVLVLVATLGTSLASDHREVQRADRVAERVVLLRKMVVLRSALFRERLASEIFVPSRRPPSEVLRTTAFEALIDEDPDKIVTRTDQALDAIDAPDQPFTQEDLDRARTPSALDDPAIGVSQTAYAALDEAVNASMSTDLDFIRESAIELGGVPLVRAGAQFDRAVRLPEEAAQLVAALADLWSAAPAERAALQSEVAMTLSTYTKSADRLRSAAADVRPLPQLSDGLATASELPRPLRTVTDDALLGGLSSSDRPSGEPVEVGTALLAGVDWLLEVDAVPMLSADAVLSASEEVASSARATEVRAAVLAVLAVAVSLAAAAAFGRSIVRPVRRLTDQAERIGSGHLDDRPPEKGPPEIVRASHAMNDVVDNLVLLERKSHALARADFADESLQQPLPGRLGSALQLSMEVLSDSIELRESLQARLEFEALHDSLTGIGNRASVHAALGSMVDEANEDAGCVAVIFIDLNDFKGINDRHGHQIGDEVLRTVASRMLSVAPARSLVARLGGDEFVIAMAGVDGDDEPVSIARRVTSAVASPIEVDGRTVSVSACAGVATLGPVFGDRSASSLLHMADLAVYTAKNGSTTDVVVYDDQLDRHLIHQRELESALAAALREDSGELRLVFQPVVDAQDARLHRVEALLRWDRPGFGAVAPDEFVAVAERSDLITEVDRWVTESALRQLASWNSDGGCPAIGVAINISGRSLLDRVLIDHLTSKVERSGIRADLLSIEVTETALVADLEMAASQLAKVRALGVRVAIDDFGTGYTSIAHLRALPVDELKIDATFVQSLPDPDNRTLIEMITQLAHQMQLPVVAEGVETLEQVEMLRSIGCDRLQGYYYSRPLEPSDLANWIADRGAIGAHSGRPPAR